MTNQKKHKNHSKLFGILLSTILTLILVSGIITNQSVPSQNATQNASVLDNNLLSNSTESDKQLAGNDRTMIFYARKNGERVKWEVELDNNDNIILLEVDGNEIDKEDFSDYEDVVYDKIDDVEEELKDINVDFDSDEFREQMEDLSESLASLKNIDVNIDFDQEHFKESMKDWAEEMEHFKVDIDFDSEELRESLSNMNFNVDFDGLSASMSDLKINLKNLDIDLNGLKIEMKKLKKYLQEVKEELISDGIIDEYDDDFSMRLSKNKMVVNGKRQSDSLHEKYAEIYEDNFGKELEEDDEFIIN